MYAEVIVDIKNSNVDKTFYYKIPNGYTNILGYRVGVPFGSRVVQGYVVNVVDKINFSSDKCKEIIEIKDSSAILTKELILLSRVLADELYCTQIQVIEAMLPTILKNKYVEYYKLVNYDIVYKKYFSKEGLILKKDLENIISIEKIELLLSKSYIKLVNLAKNQLKEKNIKYYILNKQENLGKLTAKQQILVDYLKENEEIKDKDVKDALNIGISVVKNLLQKNVIEVKYKVENEYNNTDIYINENMLNKYQYNVFNKINSALSNDNFDEFLLHGITGSGKTEIYIHLVKSILDLNKEAIILVPEIILTPQIEKKFKKVFGDNLAIIHSRLNKTEKYYEWKKIKDGKVKICLGTRSAIFAPFENLGLIIIDEEHESSYKQTETPKYDTHDVAYKRAFYNKATLVYASATPSVSLYYKFKEFNSSNLLVLDKRFNNKYPTMKLTHLEKKEDIISNELIEAIKDKIAKDEQVMLLINKRGYTNFINCFSCGHIYKCKNCDISLNYHKKDNYLQCHFCGYLQNVKSVKKCCNKPQLVSGSYGIQKVEEYLQEHIPDAIITRMDSDTTRNKGSYERLLTNFQKKKSNILLGTQMISKGLDFPDVTLVGILAVDNLISFPSFKSNEKLFQLLVQTAGRSGRSDKEGTVIVQTNIDSNIIDYAIKNDYSGFYDYEINRRKLIQYPPYFNISFFTIKGLDEDKVLLSAKSIYNFLAKHYDSTKILGPTKSIIYKINNEYKYNIAVRFNKEDYKSLHRILKYINSYFKDFYKKENISISIDNSAQDYI
ncbi:primosomal protein N' [Gemella sp. GH3]|uniref:replication restart helicase PriA n=1 Tax=unclassified Gemella TaxID=2624949 RepID=UPI0015D063E8|nr:MULTISPECIES: primosomal protein N' [unclassified Gemella]MBF0714384.1 primosomal protein N' [Gemella sp. GH3.1]NYS51336.1 primosomal protein N' [Gemella sp. GH3]